MRGKRAIDEFRKAFPGITPADAGKTAHNHPRRSDDKDHPRGCGENGTFYLLEDADGGSPPRMRGKLWVFLPLFDGYRITPADAGKTHQCIHRTHQHQDHPRGCGENRMRKATIGTHKGSPPRMRGKH